ncbi:MAG: type III-B CRISPR-associated protein Cas10/Cmr2 [Candidatus Omnitrophica bacterium]|nr:type III-B CRISPR-associated protein Cas10/Cmr2 [Candidatus Omnitrophota bacterium]MBU4479409.1 type III-B CRISPR-associated protein Cas10/Cmr2 [Candidatus Omnitrophota bacterium]MCG2703950.1 type III-B CRISPR-associated protein Cas10/Cmr2 [Candidatus Omnitrophota bacterium]
MAEKKAYLSFSLGPVQSFIATARTVRDLWSGSYLLSWLTAHAAVSVYEMSKGEAQFIEPDIQKNPIFKFTLDKSQKKPTESEIELLLIPTIPNRFIVEVDAVQADTVRKQIEQAVNEEWKKISDTVRNFLKGKWDNEYPKWDEQWDKQIKHCWDVQISVLPVCDGDVELAKKIGFSKDENDLFKARMFLLGQLNAAQKQIRYYPPHEEKDCNRPKCALCGERSQEIPQGISKDKWKETAKLTADRGERLQTKDCFCAVELVKRFAWAHYFSEEQFKCEPHKRRVWDTYTIAAFGWLKKLIPGEKSIFDWVVKCENWNGTWLSWKSPGSHDKDEYEDCPETVFDKIKGLRKTAKEKKFPEQPPSYYAILMLDGDSMGEKLISADEKKRKEISKKLTSFAMNDVPKVVKKHLGQLIYAGGDDVLAMLPCETALICSRDISSKFGGLEPGFTLSGGIAVVHVKHDLQDALDIARKAEKEAKNAGRNRLALSIVKRSGAPKTAIIGWNQIEKFNALLRKFSDEKASDRWLYQLAEKWNTLEQDFHMLNCEFFRLLKHSEKAPKKEAKSFWEEITKEPTEQRRNALILMEHASFLARNKKED